MTTPNSKPPKKPKQFTTKVRTGCITCKIRHVKCDEDRPSCRRCTSTGRKCDGYKPTKNDFVAAKCLNLTRNGTYLTQIAGSSEESRSLEFYFAKAAPKICGLLGSKTKFWSQLLHQLVQSEPAVRHALIAIGYLFERDSASYRALDPTILPHSEDRFLIQQYNQSINSLVKRTSDETTTIIVSLVTCVLFICLESLMRRPMFYMQHYDGGLKLLSIQSIDSRGNDTAQKSSNTIVDAVNETLVPLFARINLTALFHGHPCSHISWRDPNDLIARRASFSDLKEAAEVLVEIMNLSFKFIRDSTFKKYRRTFSPEDWTMRSELLFALERWLKSLYRREQFNRKDYERDPRLCLFRIFCYVTRIWLSCCVDPLEMAYDDYMENFEKILFYTEFLIAKLHNDSNVLVVGLDFSYEMEYVPPTIFCVLRCRDPLMRRKALALLSRVGQRREGMWDAQKYLAIAKRVIALEEAGLCGFSTRNFPPAKYRIHDCTSEIWVPAFKTNFFTLSGGLGSEIFKWSEMLHV